MFDYDLILSVRKTDRQKIYCQMSYRVDKLAVS